MNKDIDNFFNQIKKENDFDLEQLYYIMVSEWHWSQKDILDADIPFVLNLLIKRGDNIKREEEQLKKNKRK